MACEATRVEGIEQQKLKKQKSESAKEEEEYDDVSIEEDEDEDDDVSMEEDEDLKVPIEVDVDEYWRKDDFYADNENGLHEMTPKEWRDYSDQVDKSGGFDVPEFPNSIFYGIQPCYCSNPIVYGEVRDSSDFTIQGKNYEFYKLVKVNEEIVSGSIYYITFLAEDLERKADSGSGSGDHEKVHAGPSGCRLVELQAKVYYPIPDEERKINMELLYFNVNDTISEKGLKVVMQFAKK